MTCHEVRALAPLYLSGEMEAVRRESFASHLAACTACGREIESQIRLDSRLASLLAREYPDSTRVEHRFRQRLAAERSRRGWLAGAAAAALIAGLAASVLYRPAPVPAWFAAAARDHRSEVVERQPRRWRSTPADIETVVAPHGLSYTQAASLAPHGSRLERAKNCGIDGQRTLHLVFTNGSREYSIYLRSHRAAKAPVRIVRSGAEQVAGFETGRYRALVVTVGPRSECATLAGLTESRLDAGLRGSA